jgi:sulfite reductase (ferredoxin)
MTSSERIVFDAQILLDEGDCQKAGADAYAAMLKAAKALVQIQYDDVSENPDEIVEEFKERYYDTEKFFDPYAGGKFADYLFAEHGKAGRSFDVESARHLIEESQLFIEAVHACYNRMRTAGLKNAGAE